MSTTLFNFLLTKYQLLSLRKEDFIALYEQEGKDAFENFFSFVYMIATEESPFFLLEENMIDNVLFYYTYYRGTYLGSTQTIEEMNEVIGILNNLELQPESEKAKLKTTEIMLELRVRGYRDMSFYQHVDMAFLYQNDVNNLSWLLEKNFDSLLENPLLTDTIRYMCSIDHFFDNEKELLETVFTTLHMAEEKLPEKIPLTIIEKYQYKRLIKKELKNMKKLGLEQE